MNKSDKIKQLELVGLTREVIKSVLNDRYKLFPFAQKRKGKDSAERNKLKYELSDFDFVFEYKSLLDRIKANYEHLISNKDWQMSTRQDCVIKTNITNLVLKLRQENTLENFDKIYWEISDYFDDYGNKEQVVCKEEFNMIVPYIEKLVRIFDEKKLLNIIEILEKNKYDSIIMDLQKIVDYDYNYEDNFKKIAEKSIENMTKPEIITYITHIFRGNKFCEGFLQKHIENGILKKLAERYYVLC